MKRQLLIYSWFFLFVFGVLPFSSVVHAQEDQTILFSKSDPEMNAAITKARSNLPVFWAKFASHTTGEDGFSLKLALTDDGNTEHVWCGEIVGDSNKATCVIHNIPEYIKNFQMGETVEVDETKISDWMYRLNGKIKGGESIRVMAAKLPDEEAQQYLDMLADE
jgi:uncharacterized protein YegJ (DUF2314 family)